MKRIAGSLLVTMVMFYVAMIYRSNSMLYLAIWILLLLFLLLAYHLLTMGRLRVSLETPLHFADIGEQIPLWIRVKNRSLLPTGRVMIYLEVEYLLSGNIRKISLPCTLSGRQWERHHSEVKLSSVFTPEHMGGIRIRIVKVVQYDYFGIFGFPIRRKHLDVDESVSVLPKRKAIGISLGGDETMRYYDRETDRSIFGEDNPPEISDIRQYRAGDRLRSIHWKLSAKQDDLMVYDFWSENPPVIVLFLEPFTEKKDKVSGKRVRKGRKSYRKQTGTHLEKYLTFVYSISAELLEKGCTHYIAYYDKSRQCATRSVISGEEKLYGFVGKMQENTLCSDVALEQLREEYRDKYRQTAGNTECILTHGFSCVCGEETLAVWKK